MTFKCSCGPAISCTYPNCKEGLNWKEPAQQENSFSVEEWTELYRLREEVKGPSGYATWRDAAIDERIKRVEAARAAQQERKPRLTEEEVGLLVTDFVRQEGWPLHGLVRRVETYLSERKPTAQASGADFAYIGPPLD
jgi:hypothetical protein